MKKNIILGALFLLFALISCEKENNNDPEDNSSDLIIQKDNQDDRINTDSAGVVSSVSALGLKSTVEEEELAGDLPLVLVAQVEALTDGEGATLRATHVALSSNYAFVSYNYEGDRYLGGMDIIDISNPDAPTIVASAILPETDLSSIVYSNGSIIVAGAKSSLHEDESNPACLIKIDFANNLLSGAYQYIDLPGYVATDVAVNADAYFGVSGDVGSLHGFNLTDDSSIGSAILSDLRAVGVQDGQVVVLSGDEGVHVYNTSDLSEVSSFSTSADVPGKRTIDFYDGHVLTAEGYNGVGIYNLSTGNSVNSIGLPDATGLEVDPDEVVCNAVSVNGEHVFVANGAAGVSVLKINSNAIDDLTDFGSLDLSGSANYVMSRDEYVFVADGFGGLQILKMVTVDEATEVECSANYSEYDGNKNLVVNSGDDLGYSGSASLDKIELNSNSSLFWCGSLSVSKHVNINDGSELTIKGSMAQGENGQKFTINSGGTLNVEGSLVIYGDLMLNSQSTINFLGSNSSITIHGDVTNNGNVTITGTYTDTGNKLSN